MKEMTDEEAVAAVMKVKDMAVQLREMAKQRNQLREALDSIIDVALELDELVHYSRGVGAYIEDEGITKARAALKATEE